MPQDDQSRIARDRPAVGEREFDLCDVLTITTGILLCPITGTRKHPIDGCYDILNYMTGQSLFTHQLARVCKEAAPALLALYPQLAEISIPEFASPEEVERWVAQQRERYGASFKVPRLNADQHERIDPVSELVEKVHPDRIIVVGGDR